MGYLKKIFALSITPVVVYAMIAMHNKIAGVTNDVSADAGLVDWIGLILSI